MPAARARHLHGLREVQAVQPGRHQLRSLRHLRQDDEQGTVQPLRRAPCGLAPYRGRRAALPDVRSPARSMQHLRADSARHRPAGRQAAVPNVLPQRPVFPPRMQQLRHHRADLPPRALPRVRGSRPGPGRAVGTRPADARRPRTRCRRTDPPARHILAAMAIRPGPVTPPSTRSSHREPSPRYVPR